MACSSTTYGRKWKSGQTTVVRVPAKLVPKILSYARDLDERTGADEMNEPLAEYRTAN